MISQFLSVAGVCLASSVPLNAPTSQTYSVNNLSNAPVRATNLASDEEYIIQPNSVFQTNLKPSAYAFDANFDSQNPTDYYFVFTDQTGSSVFKDVDFADNNYYTPSSSTTELTIRNASFYGTSYMDFESIPMDPFSQRFQNYFGVNASNYSSLGSGTLERTYELVTNGSFKLSFNNYTTLDPAYNLVYNTIVCRARITLKDGSYSVNNVRAAIDVLALNKGSSNRRYVELGTNFEYAMLTTGTQSYTYDGLTYAGNVAVPGSIGLWRNVWGLDNSLIDVNVNVLNEEQVAFLTYKPVFNPEIVKTDTTEVLDDFFSLMGKAISVLFPFFGIMVFPGITIGLLVMIPLFITLIIAIFKMLKK